MPELMDDGACEGVPRGVVLGRGDSLGVLGRGDSLGALTLPEIDVLPVQGGNLGVNL